MISMSTQTFSHSQHDELTSVIGYIHPLVGAAILTTVYDLRIFNYHVTFILISVN